MPSIRSVPIYSTERLPHLAGKAKRVIHFFLNGGPSHVDTFDPKPALAKYAGQPLPEHLDDRAEDRARRFLRRSSFRDTAQSGIEISELFAKTAQHADDIAVIRSMYAQVPNHEPSLMLMNCGDSVQPRPSVGAWVLYGLGAENQNLPGFIAMCPGGYPIKDAENWQSGFLPGAYQGTFIDPQHEEIDKLIENIRSPHATLPTAAAAARSAADSSMPSIAPRDPIRGSMPASSRSSWPFACRSRRPRRSTCRREPQHIRRALRRGRSWPADADRPAAAGARRALRAALARRRPAVGQPRQHRGQSSQAWRARSTSRSPRC